MPSLWFLKFKCNESLELDQHVRQALQILAREDLIHSEVEFQAQKHAEIIFKYLILDFIENAFGIFFASSPSDGVCQETM